jgi:hypothetical protein
MPKSTTVVFIHGLARKPPPEKLEEIWRWGLDVDNPKPEVFGYANPGIQTSENLKVVQVYWADAFYSDFEQNFDSYYESTDAASHIESIPIDSHTQSMPKSAAVPSREETVFVDKLTARIEGASNAKNSEADNPNALPRTTQDTKQLERVPLPPFVKRAVIRKFATEAYYYLFDKPYTRDDGKVVAIKSELQRRFLDSLKLAQSQSDRVIVISHSMGTMIAYDVLRNLPDCPKIDGFITAGSPLGIDEIQDELFPKDDSKNPYPSQSLIGDWVNIYDPLDPICGFDPCLLNDFLHPGAKTIVDIREDNWGNWRHTITHYLAGPKMRGAIRRLAGL